MGFHGFHLVVCDEAEINVEMLYGCAFGGGKSKKPVGLVEESGPVGKGADFGARGGGRRHIVPGGSAIPFSPFYTPSADPPPSHDASEGPFSFFLSPLSGTSPTKRGVVSPKLSSHVT